jgi:hypothetical protein
MPTLPDGMRLKVAAIQTGNGNNFRMEIDGDAISTAGYLHIFTTPDLDMPLPSWPDVGRHLELKMAAIQPESGTNF